MCSAAPLRLARCIASTPGNTPEGTHSSSSSMSAWLGGRGLASGPPPPPLTTISCRAAPARRARAARPRIAAAGVSLAGGACGGATGRAGRAPGARSLRSSPPAAWVSLAAAPPAWRSGAAGGDSSRLRWRGPRAQAHGQWQPGSIAAALECCATNQIRSGDLLTRVAAAAQLDVCGQAGAVGPVHS